MSKHKSEYYKISMVKYYLNNDVCVIFDCPKQTLYRWVNMKSQKKIKKLSRNPKYYKITKEQVCNTKIKMITMEELHKIVKKKYKDFDIIPQHSHKR